MKYDVRDSVEFKRSIENKKAYQLSLKYQQDMSKLGIAVHNHFADECTIDFCCCKGDNMPELKGDNGQVYSKTDYKTYLPSYKTAIKQALEELYDKVKHGDLEHQQWLKNEFDNYIKNY